LSFDSSAPDANGNCPTSTTNPQGLTSTDQQGTTQSPDNTPSKHKHKVTTGGDALELSQGEQQPPS
jgi:hypothetical protein